MSTIAWIIIVVIAAAVIVAAAWFLSQRKRSSDLRNHFGPEYDRTVRTSDSRRDAEVELERRADRVSQLHIRSLSPADRERFASEWHMVQSQFVDDPKGAVARADTLITNVMQARGYPTGDFDQRAADVSVDHPDVVNNYREAHRLATLSADGKASTEDLRQAMVLYRSLFGDLLERPEFVSVQGPDGEAAQA